MTELFCMCDSVSILKFLCQITCIKRYINSGWTTRVTEDLGVKCTSRDYYYYTVRIHFNVLMGSMLSF